MDFNTNVSIDRAFFKLKLKFVPSLARGSLFALNLKSFWLGFRSLWENPCYVVWQNVSSSSCAFSASDMARFFDTL